MKHLPALLLISIIGIQSASAQVSFGNPESFNTHWQFNLSDSTSYAYPDYNDDQWRKVDLPHDWSIEGQITPSLASCTGYLPGGIGWYRKHFNVTDTLAKHYIYFEGIYNRSDVYLNGQLLGNRPNGYSSFMYDLSPYLKDGDNVIAVRVDHSRYADSRWYTGSGIYRDVYLISAPSTHISQWGIGYQLINADSKKALAEVEVAVDNPTGSENMSVTIIDPTGKKVASHSLKKITSDNRFKITIPHPELWSLVSPNLYTLKVEIKQSEKTIDSAEVKMGLRTLSFSPDRGFFLNGENMKVKGVCLHHDAGVLGAVVPREVWQRRIQQLKRLGANAIRMSHNPQAPIVYELCDSLGMLVMDEASDEWEFPKRKWIEGWNKGKPGFDGSYDFFEEWIDRDVTDMVRRDRNHPSVFLWSIGNEVDYPNDPYSHPVLDGDGNDINQPIYGGYNPEAPNAERIGKIAKRLAACVKKIDKSRPVTGALAGVAMSNHTEYPEAVDVTGYNYTEKRYELDHRQYPQRIIFGSETHSGLDSWKAVKDNNFIFGQFIWTGTDYLGESGVWPSRGLGTGLIGFGGLVKPNGHYQSVLWSESPVAYFYTYPSDTKRHWNSWDDWNYQPGDTIVVAGMTNLPYARLLLNGNEAGEKKSVDDSGMVYWTIPFQPGQLLMEGIDNSDKQTVSFMAETSGLPYALTAEFADPLPTDKNKVAIVEINVVDSNGKVVKLADNMLSCDIEGNARLLGIENSDNTDMSNPCERRRRVYRGQAIVYIAYDGPFTLTVTSPLLQPASLSYQSPLNAMESASR